MKKLSSYILYILVILISGCSTHVTSIQGNYDSIWVKFDSKSNEDFFLIAGSSYVLDSAKAQNGAVKFNLPEMYTGSKKLYIAESDKDKVKLKGSKKAVFINNIWNKYTSNVESLVWYSNGLKDIEKNLKSSKKSKIDALIWLKMNNNVYQGGQCVKPYFGLPPKTACSPSERDKKAASMCALVVGGCDSAASVIGNKLGSSTANYLTSQACSAYVSNLKGDTYDIENMLGTFATDLADNFSDHLMDSDNGLVRLFGLIAKVGVVSKRVDEFKECVNYASFQCSEVYDTWNEKPKELLSKCNARLGNKNYYSSQENMLEEKYDRFDANVNSSIKEIVALKQKKPDVIFLEIID